MFQYSFGVITRITDHLSAGVIIVLLVLIFSNSKPFLKFIKLSYWNVFYLFAYIL